MKTGRNDEDLEREIRAHIELEVEERMANGMSAQDARRAAHLAFGNVTCVQEDARALWTWLWLERAIQDLRYAFRTLGKSPGFVAVAVLSLAVGIGANTTVFTLVNAALLKPLPINDLPRVVSVFTTDERNPEMKLGASRDNYLDVRDRNAVFDQLAATGRITLNFASGTGEPEHLDGELVTGNYFSTLGTLPLIGRGFLPDEDQKEGAKLVTVLGYAVWQTRFGGDPAIVGRTILLNNQPFLVVGVMPERFRGTHPLYGTALWVPYMTYPVTTSGQFRDGLSSRRFTAFELTGRLKPGITRDQAEANLKTIAQQLALAYPNENGGRSIAITDVGAFDPGTSQSVAVSVGLLMTIVGLVLFVACINVANLLLARMTVRQRETAIRQSLGATRPRLVRQFLTEGLLLTVMSTVVGLLLAKIGLHVLWAFRPPFLDDSALDLQLDLNVLAFTATLSLVTCILFALAPAIQASRGDVKELKARGIGGNVRISRVRQLLITVQITLSLIALISAGLFVRSLQQAGRIDPGFALDELAMMSIDLGAQGYSEAQGRVFQRETLERASTVGGVQGVALADLVPLWGGGNTRSVYLEGQDPNDRRNGYIIPTGIVSARYFQVVGISMVRGRTFDDSDQPTTMAVAIVNEAMVRRFWPGQEPIGKRVRFIRTGYFEVVGVVKDSAYGSIGAPPTPILYRPLTQVSQANLSILVRARRPDDALAAVRRQIQQSDPRLPITNVMSLADALRQSLWAARMAASLLTVLAFVALMLAVIGIYGVMAYSISQRTHEIGLRLALGARRGSVFSLVLGQSFRLSLAGVAAGIFISLGTTRFIASLIYGSATDMVTFFTASLIVMAAALAASYIPARRATRIDPMLALRAE